jgi:hypothetical protein
LARVITPAGDWPDEDRTAMIASKITLAAALCASLAAPVAAQDREPSGPTVKRIGDTLTEPFDGKEIPDKLKAVQAEPYSVTGMRRCAAIIQEVSELDAVLGPDVHELADKSRAEKREEIAGTMIGSVGKSLIPFSGLVGEVTGANAERRRYALAVQAGTARRGFLKGVGLQRGCKAPARP